MMFSNISSKEALLGRGLLVHGKEHLPRHLKRVNWSLCGPSSPQKWGEMAYL